jgi:NADP-dependent 3-hydroxy acid dehydrogenase YdfG
MDLSGARVLITWATHGIGRACAWRFHEMNCQLVLVDHDEGRLQEFANEMMVYAQSNNNYSNKYMMPELVRFDMNEVHRIHEMGQKLGHIDILINNAGMFMNCEMADMVKPDEMWNMVQTNYMAPMAFVSAFAPMMKSRGEGHIINICSKAKDDHYPNGSVYCSTKAALYAYTCAMRHDLVDTPIRVTSISPGMMDSSWYDRNWNSSEGKMFDNFVPMFPEDVADQIIYCCTRPRHVQIADISSYATNQSYFSMKGVPPVARMGTSLGSENHSSDWQPFQQGWGDNFMMKGNMNGMYNNRMGGHNSPRGNMMNYPGNFNFGNNSPRSYGQGGGVYTGHSGGGQGMSGSGFRSGSPGPYRNGGSPYGSPRGSPTMQYRM